MIVPLKTVVCSLKSVKLILGVQNVSTVMNTGSLDSLVVNTTGSLDSTVVNTPGSLGSPVMNTPRSLLLDEQLAQIVYSVVAEK
jgi:hypothetical protein